jgi:ribose 5-phosphate isomerase A
MNIKMELAKTAFSLIKNKQVIGLGASSTMPFIIDRLAPAIQQGLQIQLLTSSFVTQELLLEKGLRTGIPQDYDSIDIYFDGCDQFDKELNAVKSGGGIHTQEKILASMARQFVLLGDQTKYTDSFDIKFPLVLEVLPATFRYVQKKLKNQFPGTQTAVRISDKKIGPAITGNGNYLVDCWFTQWPQPATIDETVKKITGVVETSLFYQLAQLALMPVEDKIIVIEKKAYK